MNRLDAFERCGQNLYKTNTGYFRLFAHSVTPNGCWLAAPQMREIQDIDLATGRDVYGAAVVELECVPAVYPYIRQ